MFTSFAPARRLGAALAAVLVLTSCGGGTSQIEPFRPDRVLAFGDEASTFTVDGRKYAVNGLAEDGTRDCKLLPLWIQVVANIYGFGFAECPTAAGNQQGVVLAAPGARAAELVLQVDGVAAAGGVSSKDLALVLVGTNDVLELYAQFPAQTESALLAQARARGLVIGDQVNRLVDLGARVIVSTIPDLGLTPFAREESAAHPGSDRAGLLGRLTKELNDRIRVRIVNDGRYVGLVLGDEYTQSALRQPSLFGLLNVLDQACLATAPLPDCTSATLVAGANGETWLWADAYRLATNGQRQLGAQAERLARNNPF